jgi:uncharacterized protein with beta-barrel porin domain
LLSTAVVATTVAVPFASSPTTAACSEAFPGAGETVTCSAGLDTVGVYAAPGITDVTVNVLDLAVVETESTAITLRADSQVTLYGSAAVRTTDHYTQGIYVKGDRGVVTLEDSSSIRTQGNIGHAIHTFGYDAKVALSDASTIVTQGDYAYGIYVLRGNGSITLNDSSSILTEGGHAFGAYIAGRSGTITLNGSSSITTYGENSHGAYIRGHYLASTGTITISEASTVTTTGVDANAVRFRWGSHTLLNGGTLRSANGIAVVGSDESVNSDTIVNYGIIASEAGAAINLRQGDDSLTLGTGSEITGSIDGGDGADRVILVGEGSEDDDFRNFETLTMNGVEWILSGSGTFGSIAVNSGRLSINGSLGAAQISLAADAILGGSGMLVGNVTSAGTVAAGNSVGTLTIDGDFTQSGGGFEVEFDANGLDLVTVTGAATLSNSPALTIVSLDGASTAYGVILHADGGITGSFSSPVFAGLGLVSIVQTANDITLVVIDETAAAASHHALLQGSMSFFDQLIAEQIRACGDESNSAVEVRLSSAASCQARLWGKAFGQRGSEEARHGNRAFDYSVNGIAFGAEGEDRNGWRFGTSLGLGDSTVAVEGENGTSSLQSVMAGMYGTFQNNGAFMAAALGGGRQLVDLFRATRMSGTVVEAEADTAGWQVGGSLTAGFEIDLDGGWTITPRASMSYLHQWLESYEEEIATYEASIDAHDTGLLRLKAEVEARRHHIVGDMDWSPRAKLGLINDIGRGGTAKGAFSTGAEFELALNEDSRLSAVGGLGIDLNLGDHVKGQLLYEGEASAAGSAHAIMGSLKLTW